LGQYHTLDLELNRNFTIYKSEWDSIALDRIQEACDVKKRADVAAIVLQEGKHVCLIYRLALIILFRPSKYMFSNT
jgi:protein pelota